MAYTITDPSVGVTPQIGQTVSALSVGALPTGMRPGRRVRGNDPTLGGGEFIFLPCGSGVVSNTLCTYRESASGVYTVAAVPNTAGLAQPLVVNMAAGAANNYTWFMFSGVVPIKKTATKVNPNVAVFISATAGRIFATATSGKQVLGARSSNTATVASATSTVTVTINSPHAQGQAV